MRQRAGPEQWFHISIALERCALRLPLPGAPAPEPISAPTPVRRGSAAGPAGGTGGRGGRPGARAGPRGAADGFRGLRAGWRALSVRYSWGGDGEARLRVSARQLSAIGCLPGVPQLQARRPHMWIVAGLG